MWLLSLVSALMSAIWWASRSRMNLRTSVSVFVGPTVAVIISMRSEGVNVHVVVWSIAVACMIALMMSVFGMRISMFGFVRVFASGGNVSCDIACWWEFKC